MEATKAMKKYSVGDMARMLSISPPTIRFYDQEKVVVPNRNEENQYREYTVVDGNYLLKTKELKNVGLGVQDIQKMLNEYQLSQFKQGLLLAEKQLEQEIARLSLFHEGVKKYEERCQMCAHAGQITLKERPELFRYTHQINDVFLEGPGRAEALKKWTDLLPLTVFSFLFRKEDILTEPEEADLHWGFSIEAPYAEAVSLAADPLAEHLLPCSSVHFIFSTKNEVFLKACHLKPALEYLDQHHFTLCGDIVGNSLARVIDKKGITEHFYEVWFPIE